MFPFINEVVTYVGGGGQIDYITDMVEGFIVYNNFITTEDFSGLALRRILSRDFDFLANEYRLDGKIFGYINSDRILVISIKYFAANNP